MGEVKNSNLEILRAVHKQIERLPLQHAMSEPEHALANAFLVLMNVLISERELDRNKKLL